MTVVSSPLDHHRSASLAGQVALVTGAARGLGAAIAHGLFDKGCRVVFADIDGTENEKSARAIDPDGERTQLLEVDVSNVVSVEAAFQSVIARWGRVDILVNNAAVARSTPLWEIGEDEWDHVIGVNLRSVFFLSRIAGKHMRENGYGRIINIASLRARWRGRAAPTTPRRKAAFLR